MKGLLDKLGGRIQSEEFLLAILAWRTTPPADGFSPAFGLFGRHLRAELPDIRVPGPVAQTEFARARADVVRKSTENAGGIDLKPLEIGDRVHMQNTRTGDWMPGGIINRRIGERSYEVKTDGGLFPRNRRFLRLAITPLEEEISPHTHDTAVRIPLRRSLRVRERRRVSFAPGTKERN